MDQIKKEAEKEKGTKKEEARIEWNKSEFAREPRYFIRVATWVEKYPQFWGISGRVKCEARRRNLLVRVVWEIYREDAVGKQMTKTVGTETLQRILRKRTCK